MNLTKERVPLQIIDGRLVLTSVIECDSLRIRKQLMDFVIDTGSTDSYLSQKDTIKLQVHTAEKQAIGEGCRFFKLAAIKGMSWMKEKAKNIKEFKKILNAQVFVKNAKV